MGTYSKLLEDVYRQAGVVPTWPVLDRIDVGQIITRTAGGLRHQTTLKDLLPQESFPVHEDEPEKKDHVFRVAYGVAAELNAGATASVASLKLRFEEASSYLFLLRGGRVRRFEQQLGVRQAMLRLRSEGIWQKDWHLVSWVRSAATCVVLIADEAGLVATATAQVGLPASVDHLDLAALDISSNVAWTPTRGIDYRTSDATPLHQALRVKRWPRRKVVEGTRPIEAGGDQDMDDAEYAVEVVDPEEIFRSESSSGSEAAGGSESP